MSDNSKIEWTDSTWSPTLGCTNVSEGCDHCYAMRTVHRMAFNPNEKVAAAAEGLTAYRPSVGVVWTNNVRMLPDRLDLPLKWAKPRRVFVDSQSDLFHDQVTDEFIARVWVTMAAASQHTFQILTKRHARMRSLLSSPDFQVLAGRAAFGFMQEHKRRVNWHWPLRNVWLGCSVENQKWADIRIPALLETPAAVRFLSCEPLLGPIDLRPWLDPAMLCLSGCADKPTGSRPHCSVSCKQLGGTMGQIGWVIVGGESGHGARPMHPDWARSLRDQCQAADVPFFLKQWGEWGPAPWSVRIPNAGTLTKDELAAAKADAEARGATHCLQTSGHLYQPDHKPWSVERDPDGDYPGAIRRWGKKAAGRELDGRTHDAYPAVTS